MRADKTGRLDIRIKLTTNGAVCSLMLCFEVIDRVQIRISRCLFTRVYSVDGQLLTEVLIVLAIGIFHQGCRPSQAGHAYLQPEWHQPWHSVYCFQQARHRCPCCQGVERTAC